MVDVNTDKNIEKLITKAIQDVEISKLPDDVIISTMTITCKIDTEFFCGNISKYINLKPTCILSVASGKIDDPTTNRSMIKQKPTKKKKLIKRKKGFYNQVTMNVSVKSKKKKPVNIKLFSNGAIQMTGCKSVENAVDTLANIFPELLITKAIIDRNKNKVVEKPFVSNPHIINLKNIKNFKIAMINSGFKLPFKIDRGKLYNLLLMDNVDCLFDPGKHAPVNIKYSHAEKPITIFVFEKGSVIITGGRNCSQILEAYNFINKYLLENYKHIVKNDVLLTSNIIKYLDPKKITEADSENEFDLDRF